LKDTGQCDSVHSANSAGEHDSQRGDEAFVPDFGWPEWIHRRALLNAAAATVHRQTTPGGGDSKVDSRAGEIITDRLSLEQTVYNLIDNAIKYLVPDRIIQINVRTRRLPSVQVIIAIEDNGSGIAESETHV
jgi:signal transduction histidine kinase